MFDLYVSVYVCMYVCMYVCLFVCMYVSVYTQYTHIVVALHENEMRVLLPLLNFVGSCFRA